MYGVSVKEGDKSVSTRSVIHDKSSSIPAFDSAPWKQLHIDVLQERARGLADTKFELAYRASQSELRRRKF